MVNDTIPINIVCVSLIEKELLKEPMCITPIKISQEVKVGHISDIFKVCIHINTIFVVMLSGYDPIPLKMNIFD